MKFLFDFIFYQVGLVAFVFLILISYIVRTNRKLDFVIKQLAKNDVSEKELESLKKNKKSKYLKILYFLRDLKQLLNQKQRLKNLLKEYFVTANIITVLGGAILAVGTGYFVRFAIYDNIINIIGRIILSIIVSSFLIIVAHKLRKTHRAYSAILIGTALGILYYIAGSAYYNYNLFGLKSVLIISIIITVFAVTLSFIYKRLSLLILSMLAAYTVPFLINYNQHLSPNILFFYLLMIDIGVLFVLYFRKSVILSLIAFTFTGVFFLIWFAPAFQANDYSNFENGFIFATVFYIIIFLINIISNIVNGIKFTPFELASVIMLNTLYYTAGSILLQYINPGYLGVFTMFIAVWILLLLYIIQNIKKVDIAISYLLIGLFIVFITIIPPIEFVGKSISMIWSIQILMLVYVGQKTELFLMKLSSTGLALLMIAFTAYDMIELYNLTSMHATPKLPVLNLDFIASSMVVAGLLIYIFLLIRFKKEYFALFIKTKLLIYIFGIVAVVILYFNIFLEINYHITIGVESELARKIILGIYNFSFILALALFLFFIKQTKINLISAIVLNIAILLYFSYYYFIIIQSRNELLSAIGLNSAQFWNHLIIILLIIIIGFFTYINMNRYFSKHKIISEFTLWPFVLLILVFVSFEFDNIWLILFKDVEVLQSELLPKIHRLPYTLLWSIFAGISITIGTLFKIRQLRQVSVFIVFISISKLFIWDLAKTQAADKTIPLMAIGGILLLISFIYQFNKK